MSTNAAREQLGIDRRLSHTAKLLRHRYPKRLTRLRTMQETQPNNPLHGVTLEQLLNELVSFYGWDALGRKIEIRCFTHDPSITSSLKFLRRTPWARERVESLYIEMAQGIGTKRL